MSAKCDLRQKFDHWSPMGVCCDFFFSSRRRHTRFDCDWSSDVCSSDLNGEVTFPLDYFSGGRSGLDFGLDKLTADELVNCFDALCTCGIEQHDPENLRKDRKSVV